MAIKVKHKETSFGVGDVVAVHQRIKEGEKQRTQIFEGMVIGIKGREDEKSFTIRRVGVQQVGIERIFPLNAPTIERVEVVKSGAEGVRRAKLYYIREKPRREIEKIYSRAKLKGNKAPKPAKAKKKTSKK
jgi:large subunit ribosomal protein L19